VSENSFHIFGRSRTPPVTKAYPTAEIPVA